MSEAGPSERLRISVGLFALATESLRLRSNDRLRLMSFDELIVERLCSNPSQQPVDRESVLDHLEALPADGDVVIELSLSEAAKASLRDWRTDASGLVGRTLSISEAVSALLFIYRVEHQVAATLKEFGRRTPKMSGDAQEMGVSTNVLPFPNSKA